MVSAFTVTVVRYDHMIGTQPDAVCAACRVGKLVLVDLAGSERLKDTGSSAKEAVRETGAINKSLFMLGQVLAALSVRGGCGVTGHVPYRDSRLTQLLWDGLRGELCGTCKQTPTTGRLTRASCTNSTHPHCRIHI